MNKLLVAVVLVVGLALASGAKAPAQTMVEYGGLASQKPATGKVGASLNHKFGAVKNRQSRPRKGKARR